MKQNKDLITLSTHVSRKFHEKVSKKAKELGILKAELIRRALIEYLNTH